MNVLKKRIGMALFFLVGFTAIPFTTGCSRSLPRGGVGNLGRYNYSPSVIQTGNTRQIWWCSQGVNSSDSSQDTDAIYFEWINMSTHQSYGPVQVLSETPGAWDSAFTCNPKVVGGIFKNPLGDGQTYTFAMYYVATAQGGGTNNSIGVAFSNNGITWKKYPRPIIQSTSQAGYGVGQPVLYNADQKSAITMFYQDDGPTVHYVAAVSTDGLHFKVQGTLTSYGLDEDDPQASWGDMTYDPKAGEWYAVFNRPLRPPSATGGVLERGQYGIELYKIRQDALLTGASPWKQLVTLDTNATGFESNFLAGFVRDFYGNIDLTSSPSINMYVSVSDPPPDWDATPAEAGNSAIIQTWILMPMEWVPDPVATVPLYRYFNGNVHEVTTGWVSPDGSFQLQELLGHLYANPLQGATVPFYGCKGAQTDYFVSLDIGCEGQRILGKQGYGYPQAVPGLNLVALYRCSTGYDHFVSRDSECEGQKTDELLGYVAP